MDINKGRFCSQELRKIGVARVVGIGDDDFIACLQERREYHEKAWRSARGYDYLIRSNLCAIFFKILLADRLPELYYPQAVGIMGTPLLDCLDCTLTYDFWCGKIWFSNLQMDDMTPLSFKFMGLFQDIHDYEWRDIAGPFGCPV